MCAGRPLTTTKVHPTRALAQVRPGARMDEVDPEAPDPMLADDSDVTYVALRCAPRCRAAEATSLGDACVQTRTQLGGSHPR